MSVDPTPGRAMALSDDDCDRLIRVALPKTRPSPGFRALCRLGFAAALAARPEGAPTPQAAERPPFDSDNFDSVLGKYAQAACHHDQAGMRAGYIALRDLYAAPPQPAAAPAVTGSTVESASGAALKVTRFDLSNEARAALTTTGGLPAAAASTRLRGVYQPEPGSNNVKPPPRKP